MNYPAILFLPHLLFRRKSRQKGLHHFALKQRLPAPETKQAKFKKMDVLQCAIILAKTVNENNAARKITPII